MCLTIDETKHKEFKCKIAQEDIPCYKFLILDERNDKFVTPFMNKEIIFGEDSLVSDRFEEVPNIVQYWTLDPNTEYKLRHEKIKNLITFGIHAYTDLNTAIAESWKYSVSDFRTINEDVVVLVCYIPKGTKYWIGQKDTICAEKLFFTSEMPYDLYNYRKRYIYHNISKHKYRETKIYYKNIE